MTVLMFWWIIKNHGFEDPSITAVNLDITYNYLNCLEEWNSSIKRVGKSWSLFATIEIKWWWENPGKVDHPVRMLWKGYTSFKWMRGHLRPDNLQGFQRLLSSSPVWVLSTFLAIWSQPQQTQLYIYIYLNYTIYMISLKTSTPFLAVLLIPRATLIHEDCTKLRRWPARQQTLAVSNVNPDLIRAHSCIQAHLQSLGSLYWIDQCIHEIAIKCYKSFIPWTPNPFSHRKELAIFISSSKYGQKA